MKKIIILFTMVFIFNINPSLVHAKCTNEDIIKVTELSKNIQANYEFMGQKDFDDVMQLYSLSFDFGELEDEVYIETVNNKKLTFYNSSDGYIVDAGTYGFDVYYNGCEGVRVNHFSLELKKFNRYSSRDECKNLKGKLDVCDEWYQGDISENVFIKKVSDYNGSSNVLNKYNMKKYRYFIIGGIVIVGLLIIVFIISRIKKNRLD